MTKEQLLELAKSKGVTTVSSTMTIAQIKNEINKVKSEDNQVDEVKEVTTNEKTLVEQVDLKEAVLSKPSSTNDVNDKQAQLEDRSKLILDKALEINQTLEAFETEEEKQEYINELALELGVEPTDLVSQDLPASEILTALPIRVLEQVIRRNTVIYPLLRLQRVVFRTNGVVDVHYKDYLDNDNKSGFSDVEINDYNNGIVPVYRETWKVDTETHNGYDILDTILNDTMMSVGLFVALINDFDNNIGRPFAKFLYSRMLTFLDNDTRFDEVITFTSTDIKEKAKELHTKLIELQTPSRQNLKVKPTGATKALEYALTPENTVLIMDTKYAVDYKYDLSAGTFQLAEIQLPVSDVVITAFKTFSDYITPTTLGNTEIIIMDRNVYEEFIHYQKTKVTDTPKLKQALNTYMRIGNLRYKDAVMIKYLSATEV